MVVNINEQDLDQIDREGLPESINYLFDRVGKLQMSIRTVTKGAIAPPICREQLDSAAETPHGRRP